MMRFRHGGNEGELSGTRTDWIRLAQSIVSGLQEITLDSNFDPSPYEHLSVYFVLEVLREHDENAPFARFYVNASNAFAFRGTESAVRWLVDLIENFAEIFGGGGHSHIDDISYSDELDSTSLELVFHMEHDWEPMPPLQLMPPLSDAPTGQ